MATGAKAPNAVAQAGTGKPAKLTAVATGDADSAATGIQRRMGGRSARVRDAVLQATLDALGEVGPDALTFSEIGRRSGVHATSIQRRWGSRESVILDSLLESSKLRIAMPDTGTLRTDLIDIVRSLSHYLSSTLGGGVVRMMASSRDTPALADARAAFYKARFDSAQVVFDRAIRRGELSREIEPKLVMEALSGPIYFRALMSRELIDDEFIGGVVDLALRGIGRS